MRTRARTDRAPSGAQQPLALRCVHRRGRAAVVGARSRLHLDQHLRASRPRPPDPPRRPPAGCCARESRSRAVPDRRRPAPRPPVHAPVPCPLELLRGGAPWVTRGPSPHARCGQPVPRGIHSSRAAALHAHRRERVAMERARSEAVERVEVLGGAVALVAREAVVGPHAVESLHDPVADHLGDDRRRRDRQQPRVAVHHRALRRQRGPAPARCRPPAPAREQCAAGRPRAASPRGWRGGCSCSRSGAARSPPTKTPGPRSGPGRRALRAAPAAPACCRRGRPSASAGQDHRRRDHRSGERAATGLVHARDQAPPAKSFSNRASVRHAGRMHHSVGFSALEWRRLATRAAWTTPWSAPCSPFPSGARPCRSCGAGRTASRGAPWSAAAP